MALQGSLRDFSVMEILQLVSSQKKTGCLTMEWNTERAVIFVHEGAIVSTRSPGLQRDDPLLGFLCKVHRLSDEQTRGLQTIQKESNRDLEDLLLNGRYLDAQELAGLTERQILDDLMRLVRWENGSYRFDPHTRWPQTPLVKLGIEGALIEASRRVDEQRRFVTMFKDPHQLLGVRDLPDPNEALSDEERELFGVIDGQHTVEEVVAAAPLTEYEGYEALHRMLEAKWIEVVGRRDPGQSATPPPPRRPALRHERRSPAWEAVVPIVVVAVMLGLRFVSQQVDPHTARPPANDMFAAARERDLRFALELYRREWGHYPARLGSLVDGRWVAAEQSRVRGYLIRYRPAPGLLEYRLELQPDR